MASGYYCGYCVYCPSALLLSAMLDNSRFFQPLTFGLHSVHAQPLPQADNKVFRPTRSKKQLLKDSRWQLIQPKHPATDWINGTYLLVGSEVIELK